MKRWCGQDMGRGLTVAPSCKEGHPVDGNGDSPMLVVKVVNMMCGAQTGRHASIGCSVWQGD